MDTRLKNKLCNAVRDPLANRLHTDVAEKDECYIGSTGFTGISNLISLEKNPL